MITVIDTISQATTLHNNSHLCRQRWSSSSPRVRSGERAHPPGPGEVHGEGGVPGGVPLSGPEHPGLQAQAGRGGEVRRRASPGGSGAGQTSRAELRAEEAGGGGGQEEEPGGGEHAQVGFRILRSFITHTESKNC